MSFDAANHRQAADQPLTAPKLNCTAAHKPVLRDIHYVQLEVAQAAMFAKRAIPDRVPCSTSQVCYGKLRDDRHCRCSVGCSVERLLTGKGKDHVNRGPLRPLSLSEARAFRMLFAYSD
jgi:hypothetical protein